LNFKLGGLDILKVESQPRQDRDIDRGARQYQSAPCIESLKVFERLSGQVESLN